MNVFSGYNGLLRNPSLEVLLLYYVTLLDFQFLSLDWCIYGLKQSAGEITAESFWLLLAVQK